MNNSSKGQTNFLFTAACIYLVGNEMLPLLQYYSSVYVSLFCIIVVVIRIFTRNYSKTINFFKPLILIFLFLLIDNYLNPFIEYSNFLKIVILPAYQVISTIIPIIICFYLISNNYRSTIKLLLISATAFLIITSLTSSYGLRLDPKAAKDMAAGVTFIGKEKLSEYYSRNIATFNLAYLVPIVIPVIFVYLKIGRINILQFALIIIPIVYFVIKTQYVLANFALFLSLSVIFFGGKYSLKKIVILSIVFIILSLFLANYIIDLLLFLSSISGQEASTRYRVLALVLSGGEYGETFTNRVDAYMYSVNSFLSTNMLGGRVFGGGFGSAGHSFILDMLGSYGAIGSIALFLLYRQIYRYFYKPFNTQCYYGYMIWTIYVSVFISIVNSSPNFFAIMLVTLAAYYLQNGEYIVRPKSAELTYRE